MFEVFSVIRRHVPREALAVDAAKRALLRLRSVPIELIPSAALLSAAWALRANLSAADSLYAALALRAAEPLLSTDLRLARAAGAAGIEIKTPQAGGQGFEPR